ncbi:MAG: dienelactone hydrolase family protein [Planctomycetaceae bacterium]|nr:dienelactone hydrolase family protein [Planctomycetaceae bacterium]
MLRYRLSLSLLVVAVTAGLQAQEDPAKQRLEKSPRHHEWAEVPAANGRKVKSFIVFPETDKPVPAVIVIHENRGLNDWAKSVADQLAEKGFVAIAPDLLSGTGPDGGGTESFGANATQGIYALPPEQVTSDLDAVAKYVADLDATNDKLAVAGFCWGGGQAFRYATNNPKLDAGFVFYGTAPSEEDLKKLEVPVHGFYGGSDFRITAQVPKVAETLKASDKKYDPVTYEGAGHGFMRSGEAADASPENKKAMEQGWERWVAILKKL